MVFVGERRQPCAVRPRIRIEVPQRQDDHVDRQCVAVVQVDHLLTRLVLAQVDGCGAMHHQIDLVGKRRHHPSVEPFEVRRLHPAGGKRCALQRMDLVDQLGSAQIDQRGIVDSLCPLVQRRSRANRAITLHRIVGEHGDVLGQRVHPQPGVVVGPPYTAGSGSVGVDQVHGERPAREQLGGVGGDALEQRRGRRSGADDRQLSATLCTTQSWRAHAAPVPGPRNSTDIATSSSERIRQSYRERRSNRSTLYHDMVTHPRSQFARPR